MKERPNGEGWQNSRSAQVVEAATLTGLETIGNNWKTSGDQ